MPILATIKRVVARPTFRWGAKLIRAGIAMDTALSETDSTLQGLLIQVALCAPGLREATIAVGISLMLWAVVDVLIQH